MLVLGSDARSFLTTIRSFGRAGFDVDVGWFEDDRGIAMSSRYIRDKVELPVADGAIEAWIGEINRLVERRDYAFVIPCHDAQAVPLQEYRDRLHKPERFGLIPMPGYELASNKHALHEIAMKCGVPVPEQRPAHSRRDVHDAVAAYGLPIYIKPERSTDAIDPLTRREVIRIDDVQQIDDLDEAALTRGYRVQRAVHGHGVGVNILAHNGVILSALQHERLHEPPFGGGSSYRRTVPLDQTLLDYCARLVGPMHYTGPAMVEFKAMDRGARPYLMEINTRLWGSLALTAAAGFDVPLFWYQMLCEGRRDFPQNYTTNLYCRNWSGDRHWFSENMAARRDPGSHEILVPLGKVFKELVNIPAGRERSDTFAIDDPKPALAEARAVVRSVGKSVVDRLWIRRKVHRLRKYHRVKRANSFLFVCYGNICRSPFAEVLGARMLGASVASAGLYSASGRGSPAVAVDAARKLGVNLADHRSRVVTKEMLAGSDVIVIFDKANWKGLLELDPSCEDKIVYLGAFDSRFEISDPYEQPGPVFNACYQSIYRALKVFTKIRTVVV